MNNTYCFKIDNFHAIGHAEILLNGITVLAGINGCGKSTIARSVYSTINLMNDFEDIQKDWFVKKIINDIQKATRLFRFDKPIWRNISWKIQKQIQYEGFSEDRVAEIYFTYVNEIVNEIKKEQSSDIFIERAYKYLIDENPNNKDADYLSNKYKEKCHNFFKNLVQLLQQKLSDKSISHLDLCRGMQSPFLGIIGEYPDCEVDTRLIHFSENDIELIRDEQFLKPLGLTKAIYINTPMVLSCMDVNFEPKTIWSRFLSLMSEQNSSAFSETSDTTKLHCLIKGVIAGDIIEVNDLGRKVLHYKSNDGIDIDIKQTATGIKSFAYILRLLDNGWLNSQSLLIIDEPEAHLHPQWVVEFAKLLVLLQKELGVKVLVASHDPNMVAAIHDIAEYYKLSGRTNFYIAEPTENNQYDYHCLGNEIGKIFEAFNVALVKIDAYSVEEK